MKRAAIVLVAGVLASPPAPAQDLDDPSDAVNAALAGFAGFRELTEAELQDEVARLGGVEFRTRVPLDYLTREQMALYLAEVFDSEYPESEAAADARTLTAFDALAPGTDLRALRERLLRENVAGFYDERPDRRRLYSVSRERRLTPGNQIVLVHELRHALQDQYMDLHDFLPAAVGDFDDRRLALVSLLEGDATLVMERFLMKRVPGMEEMHLDFSSLALPEATFPDVPTVLREQLVRPYFAGRDFALALWRQGGWPSLRAAWDRPPESTEQILHPEKYLGRETPLNVEVGYGPEEGRLLNEGVLGELLARALLGDGAGAEATAGWGGDRFRVWDVGGATLLFWRSRWDSERDAAEFAEAALARYGRSHGPGRSEGEWSVFSRGTWSVALLRGGDGVSLVASDAERPFHAALLGRR